MSNRALAQLPYFSNLYIYSQALGGYMRGSEDGNRSIGYVIYAVFRITVPIDSEEEDDDYKRHESIAEPDVDELVLKSATVRFQT